MEISYALRAFEQSEWGLKEGLNMWVFTGGFIMKYADLGPLVKPLTDAFFIIITLIPIMQVLVFCGIVNLF